MIVADNQKADPFSASELAAHFEKMEEARLDIYAQSGVQPRYTNRASDIGDACERRLYYRRVAWREERPPSFELQSIFNEGDLHEPDILARVRRFIPINEMQRTLLDDELQLSGHIDAMATFAPIVIEAKSVEPNRWKRIRTADDLANGSPIDVKWYWQNQSYQMMQGVEAGILFLKNKVNGLIRAVHVDRCEATIQKIKDRCKRINEAVATNTPPPYVEDPAVCTTCSFVKLCSPPALGPISNLCVTIDSDDAALAERLWVENREAYHTAGEALDRLKSLAKSTAASLVRIGRLQFKVSEKTRKSYTVPASSYREVRLIDREDV